MKSHTDEFRFLAMKVRFNPFVYLGAVIIVGVGSLVSYLSTPQQLTPLEQDIVTRLNAGESIQIAESIFAGFEKLCLANSASKNLLPICNREGTYLAAISRDGSSCKTFSLDGLNVRVLSSDMTAECANSNHRVLEVLVINHDDYVVKYLDFSE